MLPWSAEIQANSIQPMKATPGDLQIFSSYDSETAAIDWELPDFEPLSAGHFPGSPFKIVQLDHLQVATREQALVLRGLASNRFLEITRLEIAGNPADFVMESANEFDLECKLLTINGAASLLPALSKFGIRPSNNGMAMSVVCNKFDISSAEFFDSIREIGEIGKLKRINLEFAGSASKRGWNFSDLQFNDPVLEGGSILVSFDGQGMLPEWLAGLVFQASERTWPQVELSVPDELATAEGVQWIQKLMMASAVPLRLQFGGQDFRIERYLRAPNNDLIGRPGRYVLKSDGEGRPEAMCIAVPDWEKWKSEPELYSGTKSLLFGNCWMYDEGLFYRTVRTTAKSFPAEFNRIEGLFLGERSFAEYSF